MKVGFRETYSEYKKFGEWEAQIIGLPQARCYGSTVYEAVGKLILTFGKEYDIEFCDASEMQDQRAKKV